MKRLYKRIDMRKWLHDRAGDVAIDDNLLHRSRAARIGKRLIQASALVNALMPVLLFVGLLVVAAAPAYAQAPGGSIFGGNDQTIGNGVREAIKWGRNLLFLLGVFGVMWAVLNYMMEKNWSKQLIGGIACFCFGGVASLAYSFSQGQAVNLDTNLGN
jgi:Zn-dependent protease with chaperone function